MNHQAELWAILGGVFASMAGAYTAIFAGLRAARRGKGRKTLSHKLRIG